MKDYMEIRAQVNKSALLLQVYVCKRDIISPFSHDNHRICRSDAIRFGMCEGRLASRGTSPGFHAAQFGAEPFR